MEEQTKGNHPRHRTLPTTNLSKLRPALQKTPPNTTEAHSPSRYADEDEGSIARRTVPTVRIAPTLSRHHVEPKEGTLGSLHTPTLGFPPNFPQPYPKSYSRQKYTDGMKSDVRIWASSKLEICWRLHHFSVRHHSYSIHRDRMIRRRRGQTIRPYRRRNHRSKPLQTTVHGRPS
jgi:hypothetical protein